MIASSSRPRISAVLGPTNTGKTHFAIERMLAHRTGMVGFPLRLLARENYDRVVAVKGRRSVALITGEEKILPPTAVYFLCTVESMPLDRQVDFLAVDEIQLAADPERGHVFTDRLLRARGLSETMFLGADTARRMIRRLVPDAEYISRPRLSSLAYTGPRRLTRLPRRTAAIAFSAAGVYELADLLRRRQGGVAVVLGALSPRTRNAQVAMYQAGEVDYLVATDAIGMGLNMDIDHVAFASLVKFDGRAPRQLGPHEVAQIAGRAGRYLRDGTFGTTGGVGALDETVIAAVENHDFESLKGLYWRSSDHDFTSVDNLRRSLDAVPPDPVLLRAPLADDHRALIVLAELPDVRERAATPDTVRLLWDVCQVPDFRKILSDSHARLLAGLFRRLSDFDGRLPVDWVARQIDALDRIDGEIEVLTQRITFIRTWTYIAHRPGWLDDPGHWQERTRAIEDRLSDALHERLTQRFVDRRAATLARGRAAKGTLLAAVTDDDEVLVEGQHVGRLQGFRFVADAGAQGDDARVIAAAATQALRVEIDHRVRRLQQSADNDIALDLDGRINWRGAHIATAIAGADIISPDLQVRNTDLLAPHQRELVRQRLRDWLTGRIARALAPLIGLREALPGLPAAARGIAFQLGENLGAVPGALVAAQVRALDKPGRRALAAAGVRIGTGASFLPSLTKPKDRGLRRLLWQIHHGGVSADIPPAIVSMARGGPVPDDAALAQGFVPAGRWLIRADALERLAREVGRLARQGPFVPPPTLARLIGTDSDSLEEVVTALGYRLVERDDRGPVFARHGRSGARGKNARKSSPRRKPASANPDSPFAKLRELQFVK